MFSVFGSDPSLTDQTEKEGSSSSPQVPIKQTRRREKPQLSCTNCRHKKLRCDRVKPCLNCTKRGHPESCDYVKQQPGPRPVRPQGTAQLQDRIQQLENTVKSLLNGQSTDAETSHVTPTDNGGFTSSTPRSLSEKIDPATPKSSAGVFIKERDEPNFVGSEHWETVLEDIAELKIELDAPDTSQILESKPRILFGMNEVSRSEIMSSIPPKQVCDMLISRFFKTMDMAPMIVHVPTFMLEYDKMFNEPDEVPLMWIGLLFSILGLSSLFYAASGDKLHTIPQPFTSMVEMSWHFRDRVAQCLVEVNYLRPRPYTVSTLCFYHALEKFQSPNSEFSAYIVLGIIIRVAMRLGYHRDASHYPSITPFDGEMRRRRWATILQLDVTSAAQIGLPRMIRDEETDTAEPRNLLDSDFDQDVTELPPPRPDTDITPVTFVIFMVRTLRQFGAVVDKINSINAPSYDEILRLDSKQLEIHTTIPSHLTMRGLSLSILDDAGLILRRCALEACFQKSRCVLHRKYLIPGKTNPQFQYSRNAAVDAAMKLLDVQNMVSEASKPGGQLFGENWRTSALINQDYVLAAMIICLDLAWDLRLESRSVTSEQGEVEAIWPKSQRLNAVKKSYDIWGQWLSFSTLAAKAVEALKVMLKDVEPRDHSTINVLDDLQTTNVEALPSVSSNEELERSHEFSFFAPPSVKADPGVPPAADLLGGMDVDMNFDWELWDNQFRNSTIPMVLENEDPYFGFDFGSFS